MRGDKRVKKGDIMYRFDVLLCDVLLMYYFYCLYCLISRDCLSVPHRDRSCEVGPTCL